MTARLEWELVESSDGSIVARAKVLGGWLVKLEELSHPAGEYDKQSGIFMPGTPEVVSSSTVFVPDPLYAWE